MKTKSKQTLSSILCAALIAAVALCTAGCADRGHQDPEPVTPLYTAADSPHALGEGSTSFPVSVVHLDGTQVQFEISTDAQTVGEALEEVGLIQGEEGPYGLMITAVNGIRVVYEQDRAYWAFYIDGTYASTGVDSTEIVSGCSYELRAEKVE